MQKWTPILREGRYTTALPEQISGERAGYFVNGEGTPGNPYGNKESRINT